MINKVILEGVLKRTPYMTETQKGTKKALFTLEIKTYEENATTKYLELECYGKQAEKLANLKGGETIYAEGSLYKWKKGEEYMLAISADKVEVAGATQSTTDKKAEESKPQWNGGITYEILDSDLPF